MLRSRLPTGGVNIFQKIRAKRSETAAQGIELFDLSIGEPKGPALMSARKAARDAVMSDREAMHAYQYNDSPAVPDFARRFVTAHLSRVMPAKSVDYLAIPGIKPMFGLLPLACGCALDDITVATMTRPGYPIPADWCDYHIRVTHYPLPLNSQNQFRFSTADIESRTDLVMTNYPHNPSGQIATKDWLRTLCQYCSDNDIRLFNDAAYYSLSHTEESAALAEVSIDYPGLSWAEAYTAAKLIGNGTGWHVGAMVGSPDFIADMKEVKGKTDAGIVAPMAAGAIAALEDDQVGIGQYREMYKARLDMLIGILSDYGMRLAGEPRAGFYTLWEAPTRAFGQSLGSSEDFNFAMIDKVGVVGVHFPGCIRYAVCADIAAMEDGLRKAFQVADVVYESRAH